MSIASQCDYAGKEDMIIKADTAGIKRASHTFSDSIKNLEYLKLELDDTYNELREMAESDPKTYEDAARLGEIATELEHDVYTAGQMAEILRRAAYMYDDSEEQMLDYEIDIIENEDMLAKNDLTDICKMLNEMMGE